MQIDAGVELHNGFNHHLSKHCSDPFRAVRPGLCFVEGQDATDDPHVSWRRRGKCLKYLVLLAVLEVESAVEQKEDR